MPAEVVDSLVKNGPLGLVLLLFGYAIWWLVRQWQVSMRDHLQDKESRTLAYDKFADRISTLMSELMKSDDEVKRALGDVSAKLQGLADTRASVDALKGEVAALRSEQVALRLSLDAHAHAHTHGRQVK